MLPFREAQLLHKIATKTPPISAEDAAAVGGAGDVDKSWGSAHARLNKLVRLAARQRATSGRSGKGPAFCPLEAAVAVLTSRAKSQAMAIGAGGEGEGGGRDLFEVFFFLLDVAGGSAIDAQRYACVAEDVAAVREGSDDVVEPVSVDTFIGRLLRLQTLFGVGEPLRRDELDLIASMASEHSPRCKGPVITFGGLLGFLSFAPGNGLGKSAAHRHRALQRRERKAVLQTLRLNLSESAVTEDPESFLEALGALADSDSSGVASLAAVEPKKLHSWFLKHCRSVGVTDLTRDEVLALLRDIKASSSDSHQRGSDAAGLANGGSVVSSDCFVTLCCLEAFLQGDNHSISTVAQGAAAGESITARSSNNHVILDVQVGPSAPRALAGGYAYHQVCVHSAGGSTKSSSSRSSRANTNPHQDSSHGGLNLGSSSILSSPPVYMWCLRGKSDSIKNHTPEAESGGDDHEDGSWQGDERHMWAGTPRFSPVVDVRIEEEKASSDLVAAGYTFVGAVARSHRFLWLRRARSRAEARDLALTELAFTAGDMRRMDDRMHLPPSSTHRRYSNNSADRPRGGGGGAWVEVGSRAFQSVALSRSMRLPSKHHQGGEMDDDDDLRPGVRKAPLAGKKDMKLWCRRDSENAVPSDRLTLCLNRWSEQQRRRELEDSVRRGLRQMPPGVLQEGTHSHRVDCAVDHNRVFNEVTGGSGALTLPAWTKLLNLAGLLIDPDDNVALFRRLFVAGMASISAPKKNGTVTQATYVAFASRTEDEIDSIAEQVRHDLRWRFGILRQAGVDNHARALAQLKDALAQVARADKRGLSLEHLGYLLAAGGGLDAHLSRAELWRLAQRFGANFRGTIDLKRFVHFVGADGGSEDADGNNKTTSHLMRVTGATDALRDMVEELLGRPKIGNLEEAASEVWRSLCNGHFRRLGKPPVKPSRGGIWSCMGDNSAAFRSILLDPEDLSVAVERRLVGSRQSGDGLRLSYTEATQLAFLVAPCNPTGQISRREFMDFFAPSHEHRSLRPVTSVLEEVSGFDELLGKYEAWLTSAHKALAGQLKKGEDDEKRAELLRHYESTSKAYVSARDTTINELVAQVNAHFRILPHDPAVCAVDLVRVPWACETSLRREGEMKDGHEEKAEDEHIRVGDDGGESSSQSQGPHPPFRSASEVALLVLHCQADYFEEGFVQSEYGNEDGGHSSDSEDSERRQGRARNKNAVPPAPKPLGSSSHRSHGKGGVLFAEASVGGVHMVKLRSLLEGFCKLRLGPVPHVPHGGGAAAAPQEPEEGDGTPSSSDPSSSDKKEKGEGELPAVSLVLGDALSEKFLSGVVRQLATGQKKRRDPEVSDGWLGGVAGAVVGLLQSFAHPTVDPYPSRGVVSPRDFRKALALSGVMVTADEVEDAAEPFLVPSGLGTQIDYERFIALLRRAWLAEWDSDGGDSGSSSDQGELAEARKFLGLLRVHFKALSALQLNDTNTNFDTSMGGDASGMAADSSLLRSLRKLFRRAGGGDGRLGPADLLECLRIATDQAVALAEKQQSHRFSAGDETEAAAVPRWMGDKENLPLAGGRARRLMRRLFEFLDDEGDGRVDGEEVLMLLDRGTVGDPAAERRGQLLEHSAKSFASTGGRSSGMRGHMRFGGGGDDYGQGGRGGDSSDDDDEDGDWLLSGIVNPDASNLSGSSFSRFGRLARVTNTAKDEEVAQHPSIAKLATAVAERWPSDKDRAALKQYLQRHVRQNGTLGEQRFMRFLRKAGLLSDMSRRDVSGALAVLDPSKSQTVPVKLVLEHVIKEDSAKKEEKAEKTPEDEQKEEAENRMKKVLKEREIDRICRHVLDVSSEYGSLPGTGNLIPAFRHFDPRGRGCVPPSTASDVLAFLGCNLVDEECSLLWGCLDGFKDSQEIEYERLDHVVALRAGHLPNAPESPMMMRQTQQHATFTSPHVSFAVGNTPSHASRFFGQQQAASAIRPNRLASSMQPTPRRSHGITPGGRDLDDEALLKALARNLVSAGESEAAAWGQPTFEASAFFGQRCDPRGEGECSLEDLAIAAERLGVSLTREEAAALDACFGVGSGGVDYVSFGHFIDRIGGRTDNNNKDLQRHRRRLPDNGRSALSKQVGDVRSSIEKSAEALPHAVVSLLRLVGPTIMAQQRLGLDAAMTFEMHDPSDTGCCSVEAFVEAMRQFDLRMSLDHLQMLVDAFASSQGDDTVNYRAFLKQATLATHGDAQQDVYPSSSRFGSSRGGPASSNRLMTGVRLAPMPGPLRASWDPSFTQDQPPPQAPPPRRTATEAPTLMIDTYAGGNVLASGGALSSPSRSAAVAIWGAGTPLKQKGTIPSAVKSQLANAGRWMCLTCLFADNTPQNARCDVCGAGNPTEADAQVQQECPACHFFNSPFCSSCDMCHRPLRGHASTAQVPAEPSSKMDETSFALHRAPASSGRRNQREVENSGWAYGSDSD